jgi:hypothetical protein
MQLMKVDKLDNPKETTATVKKEQPNRDAEARRGCVESNVPPFQPRSDSQRRACDTHASRAS